MLETGASYNAPVYLSLTQGPDGLDNTIQSPEYSLQNHP